MIVSDREVMLCPSSQGPIDHPGWKDPAEHTFGHVGSGEIKKDGNIMASNSGEKSHELEIIKMHFCFHAALGNV